METTNVLVYKYGGKLHYQWTVSIIKHTDDYTIVYGKPGRKLIHHTNGEVYHCHSHSIEFFPSKRWFTVHIDMNENGTCEYYCNICMPPTSSTQHISFIDLDLDIIRNVEGTWSVVDEDEFKNNSVKLKYPKYVIENAQKSLDNLLYHIKEDEFPFNGFFDKYINKVLNGGIL